MKQRNIQTGMKNNSNSIFFNEDYVEKKIKDAQTN